MNYNYHIRITPDRYAGYTKAELFRKETFLWIPYLAHVCTYRGMSVNRMVNAWADEFKVPTENIIYLGR